MQKMQLIYIYNQNLWEGEHKTMTDWVKPLKIEITSDMGYPTETNPLEDGVLVNGVAISNANITITKDSNGNMLFVDENTSTKTLSDLSTNGSGGVQYLGDLNDVTLATPTNNDILMYSSTNSQWVNTQLNNTIEVSTNYTISDKNIVICNDSITVTLPLASEGKNIIYVIKNNDNSWFSSVTIATQNNETIDGSSTETVYSGEAMYLISNGNGWYVI